MSTTKLSIDKAETHGECIIEIYNATKPRVFWELDNNVLAKVRNIKDAAGIYFWTPEPKYPTMPGRLFGLPIHISEEPCSRLTYLFSNGDTTSYEFDLRLCP